MACVMTTTRNRIKTIIGAVSGFSASNTKLGTVDFSATTEFFNSIITNQAANGWPVIVGKSEITNRELIGQQSKHFFDWSIPVKVYVAYADDADNTYTAIEDTLNLLESALTTIANYSDGAFPMNGVERSEPDELSEKPRVVLHTFTLRGMAAD